MQRKYLLGRFDQIAVRAVGRPSPKPGRPRPGGREHCPPENVVDPLSHRKKFGSLLLEVPDQPVVQEVGVPVQRSGREPG